MLYLAKITPVIIVLLVGDQAVQEAIVIERPGQIRLHAATTKTGVIAGGLIIGLMLGL